ncbi:Oligoxyloglucan reducing end-specific cellobiohydrolase [Exidia glandulosa HHB12029]|uniref:Vacuolar protein sorting/targeting protein 10 n=1 Tax=Exidia glandulosa HHB12029 TaxID=1314781 RepID=A0A165E2Q0_EXIGL|nr:Oligoxyloglucan reducing end-specific cellobiohydrolase [Exidia glandulosa HHB12029]
MRSALSALVLLALGTWAADKPPAVGYTTFENLPTRLFYLDDTSTVFYHDMTAGNVYVSDDEGKKWELAKGIPPGDALLAIEHPFDNRVAFILTKDKKHYVTSNRGESWQEFTVPNPPAFSSNPLNGTYFVESLQDTNRNDNGFVDFENLVGVEGVGIANVVANARDVEGGRAAKALRSVITFDDGSSWQPLAPPKDPNCTGAECSLHLYSVTSPHNFGRIFSSTAPGFVMGVGSVGSRLQPYDQCDTFLSTDAGLSWKRVHEGAHKYEFGDKGAVLLIVDDEKPTDVLRYSFDSGATWKDIKLDYPVRAKVLTTLPDSTSQQFILIGQMDRARVKDRKPYVAISLDFAPSRSRQCTQSDMETWRARSMKGKECLMGHKQWYTRKKPDADCYVGGKFDDPVEHEDRCDCSDEDYECDYNYVRSGDNCVPMGPEPIPPNSCDAEKHQEMYMGSSGWRLIPGNTCKPGNNPKDAKKEKPCSQAELPEGSVSHQTFEFDSLVVQHAFFKNSKTILVRLEDGIVWQSSNEGFTWQQMEGKWLGFYMHPYSNDRGYLIGAERKMMYTTNQGRNWVAFTAPAPPNTMRIPVLAFHPKRNDWLIWTGAYGCPGKDCHARAWYTTNNGREWDSIDTYVRTCSWARDKDLKIDEELILCESYRDKKGSQEHFRPDNNPLQFIAGGNFYAKPQKIFDNIVGFAKFSEYLIVAQLPQNANGLALQVSLDGRTFAAGLFPPNMRLENHAYTILESSTDAVFLLLTRNDMEQVEWGNIMKSNSNGTYYTVSAEYVNRNHAGYVDFEKLIGVDGIALINVVSNAKSAGIDKRKEIQTRITHNDGGSWKALTPPVKDSLGQEYPCKDVKCSLQLHGFTERPDVRATYSSPSVVGLLMAVGNVGDKLAGYTDSDTFLSRDGGFTWEEIRKDAHLWEFGDSGSVLVLANDEAPTDRVVYSLNEGQTWKEYQFTTNDKMRVKSIVTISSDTSRRFILLGHYSRQPNHDVAVHLDFSQVTKRQCHMDTDNPGKDDFELWSPSEEREERCLFGKRVLFHRRIRDRNCYVGNSLLAPNITETCACTPADFECEFNHIRENGECVLVAGASPLPNDDSCPGNDEFWWERTAYRKIPHSECDGGNRPDRGVQHRCPGPSSHGAFFWIFISFIIISSTVFAAYYFYERSMYGPGAIRLPDSNSFRESGPLSTLASVPWFLIGVAGIAWNWVRSIQLPFAVDNTFRSSRRRGYRHVPVDEDAQVLRFEDEE